eukprot:2865194-Rhodomonas_salina.3
MGGRDKRQAGGGGGKGKQGGGPPRGAAQNMSYKKRRKLERDVRFGRLPVEAVSGIAEAVSEPSEESESEEDESSSYMRLMKSLRGDSKHRSALEKRKREEEGEEVEVEEQDEDDEKAEDLDDDEEEEEEEEDEDEEDDENDEEDEGSVEWEEEGDEDEAAEVEDDEDEEEEEGAARKGGKVKGGNKKDRRGSDDLEGDLDELGLDAEMPEEEEDDEEELEALAKPLKQASKKSKAGSTPASTDPFDVHFTELSLTEEEIEAGLEARTKGKWRRREVPGVSVPFLWRAGVKGVKEPGQQPMRCTSTEPFLVLTRRICCQGRGCERVRGSGAWRRRAELQRSATLSAYARARRCPALVERLKEAVAKRGKGEKKGDEDEDEDEEEGERGELSALQKGLLTVVRSADLCAYARGMQRPVLTQRMVLASTPTSSTALGDQSRFCCYQAEQLREVLALHVVNHVMKSRTVIMRNNLRLKKDPTVEARDQVPTGTSLPTRALRHAGH